MPRNSDDGRSLSETGGGRLAGAPCRRQRRADARVVSSAVCLRAANRLWSRSLAPANPRVPAAGRMECEGSLSVRLSGWRQRDSLTTRSEIVSGRDKSEPAHRSVRYCGVVLRMGPSALIIRGGMDARLPVSFPLRGGGFPTLSPAADPAALGHLNSFTSFGYAQSASDLGESGHKSPA